jgi:hypothetical protein
LPCWFCQTSSALIAFLLVFPERSNQEVSQQLLLVFMITFHALTQYPFLHVRIYVVAPVGNAICNGNLAHSPPRNSTLSSNDSSSERQQQRAIGTANDSSSSERQEQRTTAATEILT